MKYLQAILKLPGKAQLIVLNDFLCNTRSKLPSDLNHEYAYLFYIAYDKNLLPEKMTGKAIITKLQGSGEAFLSPAIF